MRAQADEHADARSRRSGELSQPIVAKTSATVNHGADDRRNAMTRYGFKESSVGTTFISISNLAHARGKATKSVKSR